MGKLLNRIASYDLRAVQMLNGHLQSKALDSLMRAVTYLGGATFTVGVTLVLLLRGHMSVKGLYALAVSHVIVQVIKYSCKRARPYCVNQAIRRIGAPMKDHSFPSGHTTAATALMTALAFGEHWSLMLLVPLASLVAISRIYLGHHYPSDVLIGGFIGIFTAVCFYL